MVCFDDYGFNGRLAGRFKGVISAYHLSIVNNYAFKTHFTHPFSLSRFLDENIVTWKASPNDLRWNFCNSKFIQARDNVSSKVTLLGGFKKKRIFLYTNLDILKLLYGNKLDTDALWKQSFSDLFVPSQFLRESLDLTRSNLRITKDTVAFHARFTTLLGDFQDVTERSLEPFEYEIFMSKVWFKMLEIFWSNKFSHVIVFSDSVRFLKYVELMQIRDSNIRIFVNDAIVVHSDRPGFEIDDYVSSFVDFYLISQCERVYLFKTGAMYASEFSKYAEMS